MPERESIRVSLAPVRDRGATDASTDAPSHAPAVSIMALVARYGARVAVRNVSLECRAGAVTAIVGPSGCGKSTLLRCINRLHETAPGASVTVLVLPLAASQARILRLS